MSESVAGAGHLKNYVVGFITSICITLASYLTVSQTLLKGGFLVGAVASFAISHAVVQLFLFLHLGDPTRPRWRMMVFLYTLMILSIVVAGSLWVMNNLNYRMM